MRGRRDTFRQPGKKLPVTNSHSCKGYLVNLTVTNGMVNTNWSASWPVRITSRDPSKYVPNSRAAHLAPLNSLCIESYACWPLLRDLDRYPTGLAAPPGWSCNWAFQTSL